MKLKVAISVALLSGLAAACGGATGSDSGDDNAAGAATTAAGAANSAAGSGANGGSGPAGSANGGAPGGSGETNGPGGAPSAGAPSGGSSNQAGAGGAHAGGTGGTAAGGAGTAGSAGAGAAGAPTGTSPLRGVGFNLSGSSCDDLKTLGVSWFYAWSATNPCPNATEQFVPQIWGSYKTLNWVPTPAKAVAKGAKFLLGFNEPDGTSQANLSVADAVALWPDFQLAGVQVGSPAVAGEDNWLPDFMTQVTAKNLRVDFIAVHWYGWDTGSCNDTTALEGRIKWAEQWNRPIWITEWSCRLQAVAVDEKFYTDALAMLKKHPLVQRYAWFLSRSTGDFANAALLDSGGKATALGTEYIAAPATR